MNMPGISPFILSSINSVLANFIAPKSYEIDLSRFFLGSDVAMSTSSIGVICLIIHGAQSLAVSVVSYYGFRELPSKLTPVAVCLRRLHRHSRQHLLLANRSNSVSTGLAPYQPLLYPSAAHRYSTRVAFGTRDPIWEIGRAHV